MLGFLGFLCLYKVISLWTQPTLMHFNALHLMKFAVVLNCDFSPDFDGSAPQSPNRGSATGPPGDFRPKTT